MSLADIVLFSTADWNTPYWTNKQHMAARLVARGHRVLFVETPGIRRPRLASGRDLGRLGRRAMAGLKALQRGPVEVRPGLWVLSPLALPLLHGQALVRATNAAILRHVLVRFLEQHGFDRPDIWTYHPFMLDCVAGLARGRLVYHCVDDIAAVPGVDAAAFQTAEERLLAMADMVFVTARRLEARCTKHCSAVHFFPNVADSDHFGRAVIGASEPRDIAAIPHPRLLFHGVLSDFKLDVGLLAAVARQRPDWQLLLIGEPREGQAESVLAPLRNLSNVHLLGARSYGDLPEYLARCDVGLLPNLLNSYTASMFPMKYYEYLAAGLPVVSTPLSFVADATGPLEVAGTVEEFVVAIERQLHRGRLTQDEARAAVGDNNWDARLDRMLGLLAGRGDNEVPA